MTLTSPFPTSEWRSILRSLLREASYLPDPVARRVWHSQIIQRFRRYKKSETSRQTDYVRLRELHTTARHNLSVLRRANEGYPQPLEKVLWTAYGRRGRRRRELVAQMLATDIPQDSAILTALLTNPLLFEDGWKPPEIISTLLESQKSNSAASQLRKKHKVKRLAPPIPEVNAWGRKVPHARRRNIRRKWYSKVLGFLLPPLPHAELQVLEGLIADTVPWKPPRRRSRPSETNTGSSKGEIIRAVLTAGPSKGETFRPYEKGRPHNITRRLMCRLWMRISCIVPRLTYNSSEKPQFTWELPKSRAPFVIHAKEGSSRELFGECEGSRENVFQSQKKC
ncbi:hypothetical protein BJX64DRAFT_271722 [Aspergillus heterothallicus]